VNLLQKWLIVGLGFGILCLVGSRNAQAQALEERIRMLEEQLQLPVWVKKLQFSGDLRLRYQYEDETDESKHQRGRFRYRLGVEANIVEGLKVGFGLASGSDDPRSTNQSFQDSFSSKPIQIDLAFADYNPTEWLEIIGGKFKNPLWTPSDFLWDSDIRPEGGTILLHSKVLPALEIFLISGVFVLDEISDGPDPFMIPIQGGATFALTKQISFQFAATYYSFINVKGSELDFSAGTNTLSDGVLAFDYDSLSLSGEIGFVKIFGNIIPYIGLIGEYVQNFDPNDDNEGFLTGIKFGYKSLKDKGQWQAAYFYRRMERDAWLDIFPDSDFLNGETNAKGHEIIVVYSVFKNVEVGIDYYHTKEIDGSRKQDLFQFDVVLKF
jgi:hypothetical protein